MQNALEKARTDIRVAALVHGELRKKRGRPPIEADLPPDFELVITSDPDAKGTVSNNKSYARNFTRFLRHVCKRNVVEEDEQEGMVTTWRSATYADYREYAYAVADTGAGKQVLINYTVNTRKYLVYKQIISFADIMTKWNPVDEGRVYRSATKSDTRQAPIMTLDRYNTLSRPTRSAFTLLLSLGLRGASLKNLKDSDYVMSQSGNSAALNVCNYKVLPDEEDRVLEIFCACEMNISRNCPVHTLEALPDLSRMSWDTMTWELDKAAASWHSAKRTAAVMLKLLVESGHLKEDEQKLCKFRI